MPRTKSTILTDAELRVMEAVWRSAPATVAEVVAAIPEESRVAYNTVLTILRILEEKGYVRHEKRGRAFVYEAAVERDEARRSTVQHVLDRFFGRSAGALVLNVLGDDELPIDEAELEKLRELLDRRQG